jgi:nucleotide-binding universal stress UspA family protein
MYKNILLPIDISDKHSWKIAFPTIVKLLRASPEAKLHIMTVVPNYGLGMLEEYFPKGWMKEITKKTKEELEKLVAKNLPDDIKPRLVVDRGVVYQAIIDRAGKVDADLIVMSANHPERVDYLLGPNVAKVARHADISVLILR